MTAQANCHPPQGGILTGLLPTQMEKAGAGRAREAIGRLGNLQMLYHPHTG